ncbi:MAG: hypothetical protein K6G88_06985 [Lachnospiraceae bacterium]|nr:hypothetical protein [Lachnospiraceae bacterium]
MKKILAMFSTMAIVTATCVTVFAASQDICDGCAKWKGGETEDNILYSRVTDEKEDYIQWKAKVWVQSDDGIRKENVDTTTGLGKKNGVSVKKGATHDHWTVPERCGYSYANPVAVR